MHTLHVLGGRASRCRRARSSGTPVRSRPFTSMWLASHGTSSAVRPVRMFTTPAGTSRRREHLGERDRRQRRTLARDHDRGVATHDRRSEARDEPEQRLVAGGDDADHAGRLGKREVEVRARRPGSSRRPPARSCRPSPRTRPTGRSRRSRHARDRSLLRRRARPRTGRGGPPSSRRPGRGSDPAGTRSRPTSPANAARAATTASRRSLRDAGPRARSACRRAVVTS